MLKDRILVAEQSMTCNIPLWPLLELDFSVRGDLILLNVYIFCCYSLTVFFISLCYKPDEEVTKNPDCPVCSKHLNELARPLPFAHCANSRLICNISGLPLNENNPPMMLPNGHVYGMNVSIQKKHKIL